MFPVNRLSPEERAQISTQIQELKATYNQLCEESGNQIQELHTELAREAEQKVFLPHFIHIQQYECLYPIISHR